MENNSELLDIVIIADSQVNTNYISGGDRIYIEFAKQWRRKGHKIRILTSEEGYSECQHYGLEGVNYIILFRRYKLPLHILYSMRIIKGALLALRINLHAKKTMVYSTSDFLPDTIPALFTKFRKKEIKWLASVYHLIPHPSKRPGGFSFSNLLSFAAQRVSLQWVAKFSDTMYTETVFVRDALVREYKIPFEKIIVCKSGISPKLIDDFPWNNGKIYDACFVARLHRSKGIFDLIEAWKYVCKFKKNAKLAIAGGGETEIIDKVKNKIKSLNLDNNISYLGFLSEEDKYKLFKASKLYVLPSYEEGIPLTFYEAMYCGIPVVTYYLPTYLDIKNDILSVPLGDSHSLAAKILSVLDDNNLIKMLSARGRTLVQDHTWEKVAGCALLQISKNNT